MCVDAIIYVAAALLIVRVHHDLLLDTLPSHRYPHASYHHASELNLRCGDVRPDLGCRSIGTPFANEKRSILGNSRALKTRGNVIEDYGSTAYRPYVREDWLQLKNGNGNSNDVE